MNIKIINKDLSRGQWNSIATHPLQSWEWGEARKQMGIEVLRIGEFKDNKLINIFQITFHQIPKTKYKVCYLPRSTFPTKHILDFLSDYGKQHNVIFIKIEPYVILSETKNLQILHFVQDDKLVKSPHPLFPTWTQILDLNQEAQQLFNHLKPKTRYNIKLAEKKGVNVKEISNDNGFEIFAKLYFETTRRQKYFGHDYQYHKLVWNNLKRNISHILIAFYKETPLAAYELFYFKKTLYYPYGGTSLEHRNFMASNLLMWEAIKFGKKLGAEKFDMWGSLSSKYSPNDPWAGFTRFKEGYGGKFTEFVGSYDLVINPVLYKIYNGLYKLREKFLEIRA